jgi:hypothetical protein
MGEYVNLVEQVLSDDSETLNEFFTNKHENDESGGPYKFQDKVYFGWVDKETKLPTGGYYIKQEDINRLQKIGNEDTVSVYRSPNGKDVFDLPWFKISFSKQYMIDKKDKVVAWIGENGYNDLVDTIDDDESNDPQTQEMAEPEKAESKEDAQTEIIDKNDETVDSSEAETLDDTQEVGDETVDSSQGEALDDGGIVDNSEDEIVDNSKMASGAIMSKDGKNMFYGMFVPGADPKPMRGIMFKIGDPKKFRNGETVEIAKYIDGNSKGTQNMNMQSFIAPKNKDSSLSLVGKEGFKALTQGAIRIEYELDDKTIKRAVSKDKAEKAKDAVEKFQDKIGQVKIDNVEYTLSDTPVKQLHKFLNK